MSHEVIHVLLPESELRISLGGGGDVERSDVVTVVLLEGSAEVFGTPLAEGRPYRWGHGDKVNKFLKILAFSNWVRHSAV
jgi:hypothetical protein